MKNTDAKLLTIISSILEIPLKKVTLSSAFEDIDNWDSLNHIKLVLAVEEEFGTKFTDIQIGKIKKPSDLLKYMQPQKSKKSR